MAIDPTDEYSEERDEIGTAISRPSRTPYGTIGLPDPVLERRHEAAFAAINAELNRKKEPGK